MQVVDISTGADLGPGETGELCARSDMNMIGYLNRPDLTEQALENGWFHSGCKALNCISLATLNISTTCTTATAI